MEMTALIRTLAATALAVLTTSEVHAVARTGGTISIAFDTGLGSCNKSQQVPADTAQDSFAIAVSGSCGGDFASAELHSDASSAAIGLHATVSGGAQAAGIVSLIDRWTMGVPVGTVQGTVFTVPVSLRLSGNIAAGSAFFPAYGRFVDYGMTLSPFSGGNLPYFQQIGRIASPGVFDQTFSGLVSFKYFGPSVPAELEFDAYLSVPGLTQGDIDFSHTLSASLVLPDGITATSSSGAPLFVSSPVPEPETLSLMVSGLLIVGAARRKSIRSHRRPELS